MAFLPVPDDNRTHLVPEEQLTADERSTLGRYWNEVQKVLGNQDPWAVLEFEGISIGGHRLPTDPDDIERLAMAGELYIDDFYTIPESG